MDTTTSLKPNKYAVLVVICTASALVPFMGSAINLSLPQIASDYGLGNVMQSWILTAYLLSSAIFQVPFGKLADIIGRYKIFSLGLLVFSLATACCSVPLGGVSLAVFRGLQGVGSAMIFSTGMAILTTTFAPHERGKVLGINTAVVYLSLALGPSVGGVITQYWGWHSIFIVTAVVSLVACVLAFKVLKGRGSEVGDRHFDYIGSTIYGFSLLLLIYGFTILPSIIGFVLLGVGAVGLVYFVGYEKVQNSPVLNVKLFFINRQFTLSSLAALINYAATFPIGFFISMYLQQVKGFEAQYTGLILIIQPIVQAVLSPFAGRLSDRVAPHYLATIGMVLIVIAMLTIGLFISSSSSTLLVIVVLVLLGIGFAAFSSPNVNSIMSSVEPKFYSMASATTGTMRLAGQAFSMGITTMIIAAFLGKEPLSPAMSVEFMKAMRTAFLVFALICSLGVYASMARSSK